MSKIKLLDNDTIEKIAAGEVIQNASSIIKEGLENSIDAKSDSIVVEVINGGFDLIRITDNGFSMSKEDLEVAFLKHATSKIVDWHDIYKLNSCGFRGEALNAIGQVSNATIIANEGEFSYKITNNYGVLNKIEEAVANKGTTLIAKDLFKNSPVRKNFLPNPRYEENKIRRILTQFAIGYPKISFKLIINGREVINTSGRDLKQAIFEVFGSEIATNLIEINIKNSDYSASGYIVKPNVNKSNNYFEMLFVNNRIISDKKIESSIEDAYKNYLPSNRKPVFFLSIELPKEKIDVNIHPTKKYASIINLERISQSLKDEIINSLENDSMINFSENKNDSDIEFIFNEENYVIDDEDISNENIAFKNVNDYTNISLFEETNEYKTDEEDKEEIDDSFKLPFEGELPNIKIDDTKDEFEVSSLEIRSIFDENMWAKNKILGVLFKKYLLIENKPNDVLVVMNLKEAMERLLYEDLSSNDSNYTQLLMEPILYNIDDYSYDLLNERLYLLQDIGFDIESITNDKFILRGIPTSINEYFSKEHMYDFFEMIEQNKNDIDEDRLKKKVCSIISHSRKDYTSYDYKVIIEKLLSFKSINASPYGKKIFTVISQDDFSKVLDE